MGFPDGFVRPSAISEQYRQVGNSVCVPMITAVADAIALQFLKAHEHNILMEKKEYVFAPTYAGVAASL